MIDRIIDTIALYSKKDKELYKKIKKMDAGETI